MTTLIFLWIYACLAVSLAACAVRAWRYASTPLHLRWELYPVPHEEARRAAYGGSRYEETDWWTRKLKVNYIGELWATAVEILTLKGVRESNRPLWWVSYPFHFGLYLLALTAALLAAALVRGAAPLLRPFYITVGLAGLLLVIVGAAGLLIRRATDPGLRNYTTPGDIFNLLFFIVSAGALLSSYAVRPESAPGTRDILRAVLTFDTGLRLAASQAAALALAAGLILYIPLTHMAHFIGKYFMYHAVRWDDSPSREAVNARIATYFTYRPTWSAPHVGADGKATWADIATRNPAAGANR